MEDSCAVFHRIRDEFGGFSNMATGLGYQVDGIGVLSSEHHYQASRFPDNPEIQHLILGISSPIMAKRKAYEFIDLTRDDWKEVNIRIMRHCIQLRYAFNLPRLSALYGKTGALPIVEKSTRDDFWGAKPVGGGKLRGVNALGRLHLEHRQTISRQPGMFTREVEAPNVSDYRLLDRDIGITHVQEDHTSPGWQAELDL